MCGQVTHTKIIIIEIHLTVNITTDKIVHMRNNSDWTYVFTIEVDIMFCAKIENNYCSLQNIPVCVSDNAVIIQACLNSCINASTNSVNMLSDSSRRVVANVY